MQSCDGFEWLWMAYGGQRGWVKCGIILSISFCKVAISNGVIDLFKQFDSAIYVIY